MNNSGSLARLMEIYTPFGEFWVDHCFLLLFTLITLDEASFPRCYCSMNDPVGDFQDVTVQ